MFDTSTLKGMKLSDLQEIAKVANIQKFKTLKKRRINYSNIRFTKYL